MAGLESPTPVGSPLAPGATKDEALDYYKRQYELLEAELADFQASSRELETELEKDVEAAETRERQLKEKVESLSFEADEWKTKCRQSKTEANSAQNKLQKEITELRETNRNMQLRLRDMEVQNDDFERQARNTTSSLEDAESKYNTALERGVLLESEVKAGEQEREALRIEAQRLREELSDLKVEAEIRQEKLRLAEETADELRASLHSAPLQADDRPFSAAAASDHSPQTSEDSVGLATPPAKSVSSATSEDPTIPSPAQVDAAAPQASKSRPSMGNTVTPRPSHYAGRARTGTRTSIPGPGGSLATPAARRTTMHRNDAGGAASHSQSLSHVRGLMSKVQSLQARVQSAKSRLPAPTHTPPRASPRPASSLSNQFIPSTVTVRSSRKRVSAATGSHSGVATPSESSGPTSSAMTPSAGRERPGSHLSFAQPIGGGGGYATTHSTKSLSSRPSSRQSLSSRQSISHLPSAAASSGRPDSRSSMSGARTPLGHHHYPPEAGKIARPRSSAAGSYSQSFQDARRSISQLGNHGMEEESPDPDRHTLTSADDLTTPTPRRQSGIPAPTKRTSMSQLPTVSGRRTSKGPATGGGTGGVEPGKMGPPPVTRKTADIGETY